MSVLEDLRKRARGGWLAVVVMGLVILGAVPFYVWELGGSRLGSICSDGSYCLSSAPDHLRRLAGESHALGVYWLVTVPLAFLLLTGWFTARARATGLQQRWGAYVTTGLVVFAVLVASVLPDADPLPHWLRALTSPLLTVALSLAVLGWVDHDRRVVVLAAVAGGVAAYIGVLSTHTFVLSDDVPGEPALSAAMSTQGALALLGLLMLACGVVWRFRDR